ncbi:hypothetical protein MRB53_015828 [Persea americana]|uniref:Uncharacterized protein n=1 Tax=Persea americana TaxID=3435 RepID=A0ACC2M1F4_PERAE|nr:hypothetical protein MRB53_015828 [Persea americana]
MASSTPPLLHLPRPHLTRRRTICAAHDAPKRAPHVLPSRRQCLLLLTASTAAAATRDLAAMAQDIPLFGLRKNLRKAEEEAEVILREGEKALEKGIETAEMGIEKAEKEIVTAEREIGTVASFGVAGDLAQAGVVTGVEVVGVLVASSVVNGILGPEGQKP